MKCGPRQGNRLKQFEILLLLSEKILKRAETNRSHTLRETVRNVQGRAKAHRDVQTHIEMIQALRDAPETNRNYQRHV